MDNVELRYQAVQCLLRARLTSDADAATLLRQLAVDLIAHADDLPSAAKTLMAVFPSMAVNFPASVTGQDKIREPIDG